MTSSPLPLGQTFNSKALSTLTTDTTSKLNILWHNRHTPAKQHDVTAEQNSIQSNEVVQPVLEGSRPQKE
jgi:hypothetical protein